MARRKKGRRISGWVIIDKPLHVGSTEVVAKTRWAFEAQKAGHAGTLDPLASGLLAVALGEATKTISVLQDALKCYAFQVRWGEQTSTDDAEGAVIARSDVQPTLEMITDVLGQFQGWIDQIPPQFSAIKVDGARAYDLARAGQSVALAPRSIWIEDLHIIDHQPTHTSFQMTCGKGGYVRSMARDLAQAMGTYAHVTHLRREWSGPFDLAQAISWDELEKLRDDPNRDERLHALERGLAGIPQVLCPDILLPRLQNGGAVATQEPSFLPSSGATDLCWAADHQGRALALGHYAAGQFHPKRVLQAEPLND